MRPLLCWARVEAAGLEVEAEGAGLGDSLPWGLMGGVRGVMDDAVSPQLPAAATHTRPSPWETGVTR